MVQTIIEVIMKDGTVTEFPVENLENFKRLCGQNIKSIRPKQNGNIHVEPEIVSTTKKKTK